MEFWGTIAAFVISFVICLVTYLIVNAVEAKNKV